MHSADLRLVFWETTAACNLTCKHCRRLELDATRDELTTAEAKTMIDGIAAVATLAPSGGGGIESAKPMPPRFQSPGDGTEPRQSQGVGPEGRRGGAPERRSPTILVFSGGEPLMRPDLWELLAHAKAAGLTLALATNGTKVDDATADRIAAAGVARVSISLDGADAATHDAFRGQARSFEAALAGQARLRARGVGTQINCTVAHHNRDQLVALRERCIAIGAEALHLFIVVPVGCGVELTDDMRLSAEEVESTLTWLADQAGDPRLFVKATCAPQFARIARQKGKLGELRGHAHGNKAGVNATTRGCLAGSAVCFVSAKGEVFPCGYLPVECGHLRKQPFPEIWRDSLVFEKLRDPNELGGKCGDCSFSSTCGGCRARAYAMTGDFLAEEPDCAYPAGGAGDRLVPRGKQPA